MEDQVGPTKALRQSGHAMTASPVIWLILRKPAVEPWHSAATGEMPMLNPAHVDGRSLIILRRRSTWAGLKFAIVASGRLDHDGEKLTLVGDNSTRVIADQERAAFMIVKPDTQIAECPGFDQYLIQV